MPEEGVRLSFVDTARSNRGTIKFFKRMGYGKPEAEVWLRRMLPRSRKKNPLWPATQVAGWPPPRAKNVR